MPDATAALNTRAVEVGREAALARELRRVGDVLSRQHLAADRVFQRDEPRAREVIVDRLDRGGDLVERDRAVGGVFERLRLDAAEHGRATALVFVGVRKLADDVFVTARAVRHQRGEVALRAAREEQPRFLAGALGQRGLQTQYGGVVAPDVVADFGRRHRREHRRSRAGNGIAPQIDHCVSLCVHG
ncbi:hypothetical protein OKW34_000616 [Paraburkholderia youngii]